MAPALPGGDVGFADPIGRYRRFFLQGKERSFCSDDYVEMLACLRHRGKAIRIDRQGLAGYLTFGHMVGPRTLVEGIGMASPSTFQGHGREASPPMPNADDAKAGEDGGAVQWIRTVRRHLEQAVDKALAGAVRPALLLSGGFDSTLLAERIVARNRGLSTWSLGFGDSDREAQAARRVADWLGTSHRHLRLTPDLTARRLRETVRRLGVPTGNPSSMATDLSAETIAAEADVVFSGLGSDELFGGHYKHVFARYWPLLKYAAAARTCWRTCKQAGRRPKKCFSLGFERGYRSFYHLLVPDALADLTGSGRFSDGGLFGETDTGGHRGQTVFDIDQNGWLLSGLVPQAVCMTAAHGIELALPFCDPSLQASMQYLPLRYKVKGLTGKWILRQAYAREIPAWVARQPRSGFTLPLARWLRGPLNGLLDEYLSREVIVARGLFDPDAVRRLVDRHLRGRADLSLALWSLATLEIWQRIFLDG